MTFQFYSNLIGQASRTFAKGLFVTGLLLVGFGLLVYWLRAIFAFIAAAIFVFAGMGCAVTAIKIFFAQRKLDKMSGADNDAYRQNVRIRIEDHNNI